MKKQTAGRIVTLFVSVVAGVLLCRSFAKTEDLIAAPSETPGVIWQVTSSAIQPEEPTEISYVISETSFPDKAFREYVLKNIDKNGDKILSDGETDAVKTINICNMGITSLKGIEKFRWLMTLKCSNNNISAVDLSSCTRLSLLEIDNNCLTDIDLSSNKLLYSADLGNNNIMILDVSSCSGLIDLKCSDNKLIDLKVPEKLKMLDCDNNSLFGIKTENIIGLKSLSAANNGIYSIDLSANTEIEYLDVSGNKLAMIDISQNPGLKQGYVNASGNIREVYVDETYKAYFNGIITDYSKVSDIRNATVDENKGIIITPEGEEKKLPGQVSYKYDIGNGTKAEFTFIPGATKKIIPSIEEIEIIYYADKENTAYPLYAFHTCENAEIKWSSADSSILRVEEDGTIIPVLPGKTVVTARAEGYEPVSISVNILKPVEYIIAEDIEIQYYTGNAVTPVPVVKAGEKILEKDVDFTIEYENNIEPGEAKAIITGKSRYHFTIEKTFRIFYKITSIKAETIPDQVYTGNAISPDVSLYNGTYKLVMDTDYKISYSNNTEIGTGIVTVTGIGKYVGTLIQTFNITVPQVTGLISTVNSLKKITLTWDVVNGAEGYCIYKYNPATKKYAFLKKIDGSTTNTYTDINLTAGSQYRYRVRAFVTVNNAYKYGKYSSKYITCTRPVRAVLVAKAGKKRAFLSWKKIEGATGYRIYMSIGNDEYTKVKNITNASTITFTKKSLKKGKIYYFRIRAYRTEKGVNIYGKYSIPKKIVSK